MREEIALFLLGCGVGLFLGSVFATKDFWVALLGLATTATGVLLLSSKR